MGRAVCPQLLGFAIAVVVWPQPCSSSGTPGDSLVLLRPLYGEKRVHDCCLPLRVAKGLLLAVLLCPCPCPRRGAQAAGTGKWVQTCWGVIGQVLIIRVSKNLSQLLVRHVGQFGEVQEVKVDLQRRDAAQGLPPLCDLQEPWCWYWDAALLLSHRCVAAVSHLMAWDVQGGPGHLDLFNSLSGTSALRRLHVACRVRVGRGRRRRRRRLRPGRGARGRPGPGPGR